jgi:hypothetical protein
MEPITAEYSLTLADLREAQSVLGNPEHRPRRSSATRGALGWFMFLTLSVILFVLLNKTSSRQSPSSTASSARQEVIGLCGLAFSLLLFSFGVTAARAARRRTLGRPRTIVLNEHGLKLLQPGRRHYWAWDAFRSFAETDKLFVLRISLEIAHKIPKRAFVNAVEVERARQLFQDRLVPPISTGALPYESRI